MPGTSSETVSVLRDARTVLARWAAPEMPRMSFATARFEPALHDDDDFRRHAIELPSSLLRATARRRAEYLAGRLCSREGVAALTGRRDAPTTGRDRAPVWPVGMVGSITHSNGWAAALVGLRQDYAGLGLDLEAPMTDDQAQRLFREVLTPREAAHVATGPRRRPGFVVTLTFSLKESLFKALHPIVCRPICFQDAEVSSWEGNHSARMVLLRDLTEEWRTGREIIAYFGRLEDLLLTIVPLQART